MAVKDLLSSIYTNLRDRISNPFFGAFIFPWLFFNWELTVKLIYNELTASQLIAELNALDFYHYFACPLGYA